MNKKTTILMLIIVLSAITLSYKVYAAKSATKISLSSPVSFPIDI